MSDPMVSGLQVHIRELLDRQSETRSLDYKAPILFGPNKKEKGEILKDMIAMSNTRDGGSILVGVNQSSGRFVPVGVSPEQAKSFDPTMVGQFAKNYCSRLPSVEAQLVAIDGVDVLLLRVYEFDSEPIICTKDLNGDDGKFILRAGSIYVRTTDACSVAIDSGEAMRDFLDLAVQKRGDALLTQIRGLVGGPTIVEAGDPVEAYGEQIDSAERFFAEALINSLDSWHVEVFPKEFDEDRTLATRLKEIRRESVVRLRGWDFPHIDVADGANFEDGIQSVTHALRHNEAHRFYRSGLFAFRSRPHEDSEDRFIGTLSLVSAIYSMTEYFLFASRYASLLMDSGDVIVQVGVSGLSNRALVAGQEMFHHEYRTKAAQFSRSYEVSLEELRSSNLDLASDATIRLFDVYGFDAAPEFINYWQEKLISRRF